MSKTDTKARGLGRGLNALFQDEETAFPAAAPDAPRGRSAKQTLGVEQLRPGRFQPRMRFEEEALDQLADSIRQHGLLQPILVRALPGEESAYEIIAGERRWRAAQRAPLHDVPVIVLDIPDAQALEIALIENLQREDLNPVEEARGYKRLMEECGHTQEKLAEALGRSRPHIANMLRLLTLPQTVLAHLEAREISAGHARALVNVPNPEALAQQIIAGGLSVRAAEALAAAQGNSKSKTGGASKNPARDKSVDTLALEAEMSRILGMKFTLDLQGAQKGVMKVEYRSLDQLDDLISRLSQQSGARLRD